MQHRGFGIRCMAWLAALVDMFSMTNLHRRYDKKLICHFIYDPVQARSDPVGSYPESFRCRLDEDPPAIAPCAEEYGQHPSLGLPRISKSTAEADWRDNAENNGATEGSASGAVRRELSCLAMGAWAQCTNIWYRRAAMARNTSITLGPHFDEFIATQIENGRYGSTSDVVRAGLRLLEETEGKLERLRRLLDEGERSGIAEYSYESVIAELDN